MYKEGLHVLHIGNMLVSHQLHVFFLWACLKNPMTLPKTW